VKRLEAGLKAFGQPSMFTNTSSNRNRPIYRFATYDDPIVEAAIDQRRKFFEASGTISIKLKSSTASSRRRRSKTGVGTALSIRAVTAIQRARLPS